ncbi:endonuclease NucS [Haloarchaeobius sp. HME9146]|uniref:endonuclease NucS n=1 Tax=Haloarchaeobius sp. HME9146 TaxID=2978732 RepID=UPI0021BFF206|nr:endonuclease NucS [Haloarchaeobius sp. HME9146]
MTRQGTADGDRTVVTPDHETARSVVDDGLADGQLVTVFGRCTVSYDGRATSQLGLGDRHVMCKPDGTVLVHTDEGQKPVNWQPPGCRQEARLSEEGTLELFSTRDSPTEELLVTFERIRQVSVFSVMDDEQLTLAGSEEDLRQRILDEPDLVESGFVPLATERETAAGAVDIYGRDTDGNVLVLELKRKRVGPDAASQLNRYVEALRRDLHAGATIRGILVAPSITDRARRLLAENGLEFVALEPPSP